jgi:hypothetical protein
MGTRLGPSFDNIIKTKTNTNRASKITGIGQNSTSTLQRLEYSCNIDEDEGIQMARPTPRKVPFSQNIRSSIQIPYVKYKKPEVGNSMRSSNSRIRVSSIRQFLLF